ncbi:DUF1365 domain-containing protein [Pseudemcibacter aquimaris]|uniref:DUF1365 domain-containing protein n=1 Tax=Pseudemcibacter aquimaris TaxID=2857064 RepID=UPI0020131A88|nr:DUF1365 domain-containing protein [Pseudemcibacter aquimaris]MCC3861181.1 DUF1365 domain-containing protein [Pseudemcibacter aquimaris]WDU57956.1 DUF1365 domain-containing protein [Pseudemcibacter aquimaris]
MDTNGLYIGSVFHKRYAPKVHKLRYKVFNLYADLDELEQLAEKNRFFSLNRFNLISLHEKDYGDPNHQNDMPLKDRILTLLSDNDVDAAAVEKIKILTYPRIFGFSFNPLTVYYCLGKNDQDIAIVYEVRNTFSERHNYIYAVPENASFYDKHFAQKRFHVSPFFDREGKYQFSLRKPGKNISLTIQYEHQGEPRLTACFSGKRAAITDKNLLLLSLKSPFMTIKVIGGILFEAMKLKLKGLRVNPHPEDHIYQSSKALKIVNENSDI